MERLKLAESGLIFSWLILILPACDEDSGPKTGRIRCSWVRHGNALYELFLLQHSRVDFLLRMPLPSSDLPEMLKN